MTIALVLLVAAFIVAVLAALNVPSSKVGLLPLAFALYLLSLLLGAWK
jgi:hypothetical protein